MREIGAFEIVMDIKFNSVESGAGISRQPFLVQQSSSAHISFLHKHFETIRTSDLGME